MRTEAEIQGEYRILRQRVLKRNRKFLRLWKVGIMMNYLTAVLTASQGLWIVTLIVTLSLVVAIFEVIRLAKEQERYSQTMG